MKSQLKMEMQMARTGPSKGLVWGLTRYDRNITVQRKLIGELIILAVIILIQKI